MEYPDSDNSNESSTHSESSFSSPPVSPLMSKGELTDSENEEESEYPDSESSEWSTESLSCSESPSLVAPCFSPLTPSNRQSNLEDGVTAIACPVAESPQHLQIPVILSHQLPFESPQCLQIPAVPSHQLPAESPQRLQIPAVPSHQLPAESPQHLQIPAVLSQQLPAENIIPTSFESPVITTYKLVGDNIDFSVKARYSRSDSPKDQSVHYFHYMAVRDRTDFSDYSSEKADTCLNSADKMAKFLLPTKECDDQLTNHLAVLVSRITVSHMPYFRFAFSDVVSWHIDHPYYEDMSKMPEVVSILCTFFVKRIRRFCCRPH